MSNLRFRCPHCGQVFEGPDKYSGRETKCSRCGNVFVLKSIGSEVAKVPCAISWYFVFFRRYFDFKGRSRRREFWWALLFQVLTCMIVGVACACWEKDSDVGLGVFSLATALPLLAVQVRRLHDTNKSGWWVLLSMLPIVNIAWFVWLVTDGDIGVNRFGPDPKGRG